MHNNQQQQFVPTHTHHCQIVILVGCVAALTSCMDDISAAQLHMKAQLRDNNLQHHDEKESWRTAKLIGYLPKNRKLRGSTELSLQLC